MSLLKINSPGPQHEDSVCMWPIGDPAKPDFAFCGAAPLPGRPYCAVHHQVAYIKVRKRESA